MTRLIAIVLAATTLAALLTGLGGLSAAAQDVLRPFVLASDGPGEMAATVKEVRRKLERAGFEIAGEYSPYATATVLAVTNDALKSAAAKSEFGGYGAVQRVSVTEAGGAGSRSIQVAYSHPSYVAAGFRMAEDLSAVAAQLEGALGKKRTYGSAAGLTSRDLRKYHYMFGMEYFDDPSVLAEYGTFEQAVQAVEAGLAAGRGATSKVYRVDIPGKDETVFGVALKSSDCSGDEYIMSRIDSGDIKSTPHLPYEVLVAGNKVYALFGRFRIAVSFPDLSMMGSGSFASIMCAPGAIEDALEAVAGK